MNKIKMGKFLKALRKERKMSQEDLSNLLQKKYLTINIKTISDWENGRTIPFLDCLMELSDFFQLSVDELLDGEKEVDEDFRKKYFIYNPNWYCGFNSDNLYEIRQKQIIKINQRFDELIKIRIKNGFTLQEEKEFRFLFENFYQLTNYYKEHIAELEMDNYLKLKYTMINCIEVNKNCSLNEIVFELKKLMKPNKDISVCLNEFLEGPPALNSYLDKRFKALPFWEKDMLLAYVQKCDLIVSRPIYSANLLKHIESRMGKEYDEEKMRREIIRYFILNGACINSYYLNFILVKKENKRIIDRVEQLYILCKKPLLGYTCENGIRNKKQIENNQKNRFVFSLYHDIKDFFDMDFDQLFLLIHQYTPSTLPDDVLIEIAKKKDIDVYRDMRYVKADLNREAKYSYAMECWGKYLKKEKEIKDGLVEMEHLLSLLEKGEKTYTTLKKEYIGGTDWASMRDYFYYWNTLVSEKELKKHRNIKETQELLSELDHLTLVEIRNKYFKEEEVYKNDEL